MRECVVFFVNGRGQEASQVWRYVAVRCSTQWQDCSVAISIFHNCESNGILIFMDILLSFDTVTKFIHLFLFSRELKFNIPTIRWWTYNKLTN